MAVAIVRLARDRPLTHVDRDEIGHAVAHLDGDVADHILRRLGQAVEDAADSAKPLKQLTLSTLADTRHAPLLIAEVVTAKGAEVFALDVLLPLEGCHIVLDGVEATQNDVKDQDVDRKVRRQLPDDSCERAADLAQLHITEEQVGVVGLHL